MGGLLSVVAQDIEVTLSTVEGITITTIHVPRSYTIAADRCSAVIKMGDIQSEESRDIPFQLVLGSLAQSSQSQPRCKYDIYIYLLWFMMVMLRIIMLLLYIIYAHFFLFDCFI